MDGIAKDNNSVFVLAASNLPWCLDMAMLRRLEKRILVPLPSTLARKKMFEKLLFPSMNHKNKRLGGAPKKQEGVKMEGDSDFENTLGYDFMAQKTEGYSGADIRLVAKEAAMRPLRRLMSKLESLNLGNNKAEGNGSVSSTTLMDALEPIDMDDVLAALKCTKASTSVKANKYEKWQDEYGSSI